MLIKFIKVFAIASSTSFCLSFLKKKTVFAKINRNIDVEFQELIPVNPDHKKVRGFLDIFGFPQRSPEVTWFKNHALCYDFTKKIPLWVLEVLTQETKKGEATREISNFKSDLNFFQFSSKNEDYNRSGWSRGHMAAAGNHRFDQEAMNDTFFLSNIVPQNLENNSGFWNRLELYSRDLLNKFDKVWVLTGPLFLSYEENGKRIIKYEVIGKSEVSVPTHLFKILLVEKNPHFLLAAFVVPNQPIEKERNLKEFQVPLEALELKAGFITFPRLERSRVLDLCQIEGCQLRPWEEFELFFITKKISSAKNLNRLEKAFAEISSRGLKPDKHLMDCYYKRKMELEKKRKLEGDREERERKLRKIS